MHSGMACLMLFQCKPRQFTIDPSVVSRDLERSVLPGVRGLRNQGEDCTR
jgi:hypothetical protein